MTTNQIQWNKFKRAQYLLLAVLVFHQSSCSDTIVVRADTNGVTKAFLKSKQATSSSTATTTTTTSSSSSNTDATINNEETSPMPTFSSTTDTKQRNDNNKKDKHWSEYDDIGSNLESHPDPNDEHYEGMIYVGRWAHTEDHHETVVDTATDPNAKRLGFDVDNSIKYIFGTSFDETHKSTVKETDLHPDYSHPDEQYVFHHHHDVADRGHETKTYEEAIRERRHRGISQEGPKPFGHFETHDQDGGADPPHVVQVEPFFLDAALVTNEQFGKFVRATYYETEAEKYGWSFVLQSFLGSNYEPKDQTTDIHVDPEATNWVAVEGAYWRRPEGPHSSYKFRERHPVVHVSHRDAAEYCKWKGKRLPGEREWEAAARAGHWGPNNRTIYVWGDAADAEVAAKHANLWGAGEFPNQNLAEDGWRGTSPVKTYPANPMGFYDMSGNVWEWTRGGKSKARIVRGASYVDNLDGLHEHQHAATLGARETVHGTTTAGNIGFRCAKAPKRRTEYHYVHHDEEIHGALAVEDQFGRRDQVPMKGWEDQFSVIHDDEDEDEIDGDKRLKRKKVVKKRERLMTEL